MNSSEYNVNENEITFSNAIIKKFDFPIKQIVKFNNLFFVLLEILGEKYNQNVFAITDTVEIIWQIEKSETIDKLAGEHPYTHIEVRNNQISLFNFCGFRFIIDPLTGK